MSTKPGQVHPSAAVASLLTAFAEEAGIANERTGGPLTLTARRLRYTLGTALAEDGHDAETIAHILDHGHTKESKAYIEVSRQIVDRVNQQITPVAERFIRRFRGQIGQAAETGARSLPIILNQGPSLDSDDNLSGIGGCGAGVLCKLAWPLSCYGCDRFVAWVDADHEGVLAALIERRNVFALSGDARIATELDDVILAVEEVIAEIARRRTQEGA